MTRAPQSIEPMTPEEARLFCMSLRDPFNTAAKPIAETYRPAELVAQWLPAKPVSDEWSCARSLDAGFEPYRAPIIMLVHDNVNGGGEHLNRDTLHAGNAGTMQTAVIVTWGRVFACPRIFVHHLSIGDDGLEHRSVIIECVNAARTLNGARKGFARLFAAVIAGNTRRLSSAAADPLCPDIPGTDGDTLQTTYRLTATHVSRCTTKSVSWDAWGPPMTLPVRYPPAY